MNYIPKKERKKVSSLRKQSSTKAFPHRGAGGSLRRGVSYEEAGVLNKLGTSVIASSGKSLREPRLLFTLSFHKEKSGFHLFKGFEFRIVDPKKGGAR